MTAVASPPPATAAVVPRRTERRLIGTLMGASALGGLGQLIGLTGTALLMEDLLGSKTFIGTGNFAMLGGTALGAYGLTRWVGRRHRRPVLVGGYVVGAVGGVVVGVGARWEWYPLVLVGLLLFGFGNTAGQQARFAAADVVTEQRRGRAVSVVVWASTIGVVFGPKLWGPAGRLMAHLGLPELGGAYVVGGGVFVLAALVCTLGLRPDTREVSRRHRPEPSGATPEVDVRACLRRPPLPLALAALVVGQVVMVAVMSVTSVHLRDHGHSTATIGTVISGHVLGMYAPSPISGWLVDRVGRVAVIAGGSAVMVAGCGLAAGAEPTDHGAILLALFLLGLGWNGNFVAGSTLVTDAVEGHERPRVQAVTDTCTFLASGVAALAAGFVLEWSSYATMSVAGAGMAATCAVAVVAYRGVSLRAAGG